MNNIIDLIIIGAGPAGLMTAKTAAESGLKVTLIEKNKNFKKLTRACSAQFILDDGYQKELIKIQKDKILFTKNNFEVNYTGDLVEVKNKYYNSPKGHKIHFALPNEKPFALKFDKQKLINDLYTECLDVGIDIRMSTLATGGCDKGDFIEVNLKNDLENYTLKSKKLVIAEGANAHITGLFGFNKERQFFATALTVKYILKNISGIEPNSWNLFYGRAFFSNPPLILGPSLYDDNTFELTITGSQNTLPDSILKNVLTNSPLKENLKNSKLIDKLGCGVKAFSSIKSPYKNNVLVIGDSAAFVEVEVQGALMCGYHAANAVKDELEGNNGFEKYGTWWKDSFEFNSDEYLRVSQGYALVPTYTDDELDYLFALVENKTLEGTYSQYKTPKLIWNAILLNIDKIKAEKPAIYSKIQKMNTISLSTMF